MDHGKGLWIPACAGMTACHLPLLLVSLATEFREFSQRANELEQQKKRMGYF